VHAEYAERTELFRQLTRQGGRLEPALDIGSQPGVDELAHGGGDIAFVGVQQPVDVEQSQRGREVHQRHIDRLFRRRHASVGRDPLQSPSP
jgi:hypothetical protein